MPVSHLSAIERIARVIAGQRLSVNADGSDPSAGPSVDMEWEQYRDDAVAILKTLREPDASMAAVGDVAVWQAMIGATLEHEG